MDGEIAFRLDLVHGRCVGVRIPSEVNDQVLALLVPEERAFVLTLAPARRTSWVAGRIALRQALRDLGVEAGPILPNSLGAPSLPPGLMGSISHKKTLAVGLAAHAQGQVQIGVDLEDIPALYASAKEARAEARPDIRTRVLTQDELTRLEAVPEEARRRVVILHFSLKESLYKAINPLVTRHVAFHEASMTPLPDGTAQVRLLLSQDQGAFAAECTWTEVEDHFLTTAKVRRA
jgi:4'-phosphopantetheinyl transferase EntD